MQPYPPLQTLIAAARLRESGYSVKLYDVTLTASLDQVARHLVADRGPRDGIAGIMSRDACGIRRTAPPALITDLDSLPDPAWDLVDVSAYRDAWLRAHGYFSLNMVSSRGCPYKCN